MRAFQVVLLTFALAACSTTEQVDYGAAIAEVDRAIAAANDNRGSLYIVGDDGERVLMSEPRREETEICGTVYESSQAGAAPSCVSLTAIERLAVYEERVSLSETASATAAAVILVPAFGLILLSCWLGGGSGSACTPG